MVKRKIVADAIGLFGIFLGIFIGITIIDAELYLNPMDYQENQLLLALPFYAALSLTSTPFLLIRKTILAEKHCLIWVMGLSLYILALTMPLLFKFETIQTFIITTAHLLLPVLAWDMLSHFQCIGKK